MVVLVVVVLLLLVLLLLLLVVLVVVVGQAAITVPSWDLMGWCAARALLRKLSWSTAVTARMGSSTYGTGDSHTFGQGGGARSRQGGALRGLAPQAEA